MHFPTLFATAALSLLSSIAQGQGAIIPRKTNDVYAPPITSPTAQTVWTIGEMATVTWDNSHKPVNVTNKNGRVVLYHPYGERGHKFVAELANNIDMEHATSVSFKVPPVELYGKPAANYTITLFGDSGNQSPDFLIKCA